jgi:hypothetical protein
LPVRFYWVRRARWLRIQKEREIRRPTERHMPEPVLATAI